MLFRMIEAFQKLEDPKKDLQARKALVKKWGDRLYNLRKKGVTQRDFCRKHEIYDSWLSKFKSVQKIPKWSSIEKVEKALEAEGV